MYINNWKWKKVTIGKTVGSDWLETFCFDSTRLSEATLSWEGRSSSLNELSEDALS